eukprot:evm.model.NODE_36558_length_9878_cov_24.109232.3
MISGTSQGSKELIVVINDSSETSVERSQSFWKVASMSKAAGAPPAATERSAGLTMMVVFA